MRTCNRKFHGVDPEISDQLALDVAADEKAIVDAIAALRERTTSSFEAIAYLLGTEPAQISRHLRGVSGTTLTNYLRMARIFGYRCKIVLERAEPTGPAEDLVTNLKIGPHQVYRTASRRDRF